MPHSGTLGQSNRCPPFLRKFAKCGEGSASSFIAMRSRSQTWPHWWLDEWLDEWRPSAQRRLWRRSRRIGGLRKYAQACGKKARRCCTSDWWAIDVPAVGLDLLLFSTHRLSESLRRIQSNKRHITRIVCILKPLKPPFPQALPQAFSLSLLPLSPLPHHLTLTSPATSPALPPLVLLVCPAFLLSRILFIQCLLAPDPTANRLNHKNPKSATRVNPLG